MLALARGAGPDLPTLSGEEIRLVVADSHFRVGGRSGHAVTLNGTIPGPLLRLREGQDVRIVVDSILTLRETGGNLSETFDVVANTIVERKKVSGKIKSMTAQGMAQGFIMCLMPPGMLLLFSFIDPTYTEPLFGTLLGWVVLALVAGLDLMGFWAMLKIVSIDV